jgi:hypothetical protein
MVGQRGNRCGRWMPRQAGMRRFGGAVSSLYRGMGAEEKPAHWMAPAWRLQATDTPRRWRDSERASAAVHNHSTDDVTRAAKAAVPARTPQRLRRQEVKISEWFGNLSGFRHRRLFRAANHPTHTSPGCEASVECGENRRFRGARECLVPWNGSRGEEVTYHDSVRPLGQQAAPQPRRALRPAARFFLPLSTSSRDSLPPWAVESECTSTAWMGRRIWVSAWPE